MSRTDPPRLLLACLLLLLTGCGGQMANQPRYEPYEASNFFADGQASRQVVEGAVPRGYVQADTLLYTGRDVAGTEGGEEGAEGDTGNTGDTSGAGEQATTDEAGGEESGSEAGDNAAQQARDDLATVYPFPITREVLERGQERYNISCTPCHGRLGNGDGMIIRRGYPAPPSLHIERLREAPPGHFFDVITNGWGVMPPYEGQIAVIDRWAITAYIEALQRSQNATLDDVPADERGALENGGQ